MNSSQSKMNKDIYEKKRINSPSTKQACRTSFKKSEKIFIFDTQNENGEKIRNIKNNHFVANLDKKGKNDNRADGMIIQKLRKSYNNLMNINFNSGNNTEIKKNQNIKRENEFNLEDYLKNNYIIVSDIKKCKLFSNNNNAIINNKNNKKIISNIYNAKNQSKINTNNIHSNTKKEVSSQDKQLQISDNNRKTKFKLNTRKNIKKLKENINAISYKSININNNIKKEMKGIKYITKYSKVPPISIFDKSYYISRYKLGNCKTERKNDRYGSKNTSRDDKKNKIKFIQTGIVNIASLKDKYDIRKSKKDNFV